MGYYVKRSYASKGAEDLIAIKNIQDVHGGIDTIHLSEVLLIQCKNLKIEKPLVKVEKDNLKKLAKQTGGTPLHVYNNSRHKLVIEEIK